MPVFASADHRKSYATAVRRIGYGQPITLRDLRHTHATLALMGTGDATAVQSIMGHGDLATTQQYLSSTQDRIGAVAAAVGQYFDARSITAGHRDGNPAE